MVPDVNIEVDAAERKIRKDLTETSIQRRVGWMRNAELEGYDLEFGHISPIHAGTEREQKQAKWK